MSIGSFLADAGYIGAEAENFVNTREVQRAQRAEAQARQLDLARREQSRQRAAGLSMADYVGPAPTYNSLAPPMDVAEGDFTAPPPPTPPPSTTPPPPPAAGTKTPAKTTAPKRMFAGVEVPYYDKNAPVRLGVDPDASDVSQFLGRGREQINLGQKMNRLADDTAVSMYEFRRPFVNQTEKADLDARQKASFWYRSKFSRDYFARNPEMISVAEKDPVGFFKTVMTKAPDPNFRMKGAKDTTEAEFKGVPSTLTQTPEGGWDQRSFMMKVGGPQGVEAGGQWIKNKEGTSSAFGPAQITDGTWLFHYNRINPKSGLSKDQILALKKDRSVYPQVFQALTTYNQQELQRAGFAVNDTNMYMMHFLGASGGPAALRFLQQDPNTPITRAIAADQRAANATLLKDKKTIGDVYNWAASKMGEAVSTQTQTQSAGVDETGGGQQPPRRMAPSEFYLNANRPEMISAGTANALQSRKRLEAIADRYRQEGRLDEFDAVLMQIDAQDVNLRMLQGMQGIMELAYSRNPSRLAAVWSDYAGTPIQIQPRTDGKYNVLSGGQIISQGVDEGTLIDRARKTFDQAYLAQQTENQNAMMLKRFELQFGMDKDMALKAMDAVSAANVAMINGRAEIAKQQVANLRRIMLASPGGGAWVAEGNSVAKLVDEYRPPGAPESVPAGPAMLPVSGSGPIRRDAGAA
jgi:hypothetical protein